MDANLEFYVMFDGTYWCATERDNHAQWGKGTTIGEAIEDYCDQWLPDNELMGINDDNDRA